jgi:hypothetical protein
VADESLTILVSAHAGMGVFHPPEVESDCRMLTDLSLTYLDRDLEVLGL